MLRTKASWLPAYVLFILLGGLSSGTDCEATEGQALCFWWRKTKENKIQNFQIGFEQGPPFPATAFSPQGMKE